MLARISVTGLFGLYDHDLQLRSDPPLTIVAGPNGVGKSTLLRLTTSLLKAAYRELPRHEFDELTITATDGTTLKAWVDVKNEESSTIRLEQKRPREPMKKGSVELRQRPAEMNLPSFLEPYGPDFFVDTRDGELLSAEEVAARYRRGYRPSAPESPEWFEPDHWKIDFIETKRLDSLLGQRRRAQRLRSSGAPIDRYLEVVEENMERARRHSARIYQSRTRTVATRLLGEYSRKSVNADRLRARYQQVSDQAAALTANGLLSDSLDVLPDEKLNPTEKRFFELFLDDFEAKLAPLEPVASRIERTEGDCVSQVSQQED